MEDLNEPVEGVFIPRPLTVRSEFRAQWPQACDAETLIDLRLEASVDGLRVVDTVFAGQVFEITALFELMNELNPLSVQRHWVIGLSTSGRLRDGPALWPIGPRRRLLRQSVGGMKQSGQVATGWSRTAGRAEAAFRCGPWVVGEVTNFSEVVAGNAGAEGFVQENGALVAQYVVPGQSEQCGGLGHK